MFGDESQKKSALDIADWQSSFEGNMNYVNFFDVDGKMEGSNLNEDINMVANQTVSVHFNLYYSGTIPHLEKQKLQTNVKMLCELDTENLGNKMKEVLELT